MLMNVKRTRIYVIRMQNATIQQVHTIVPATMGIKEMDSIVAVSTTQRLLLTYVDKIG